MGAAPLRRARRKAAGAKNSKRLSSGECYGAVDAHQRSIFLEGIKYGGKTMEKVAAVGEPVVAYSWGFADPQKQEVQTVLNGRECVVGEEDSSTPTAASSIAREIASKYDIQQLLGQGKYSEVVQVQCKKMQTQYALKIVHKFPSDQSSYRLEVSLLSRCQHPSIVALHDVVYTRDKAYLFLELAAGGDLCDRISAWGHYSEAGGRAVLKMVVDGVSYLHSNGITHRDLKLENLLCKTRREDSQIVIADFGLAHVQSGSRDETRSCPQDGDGMSTTCGTAEYMSPEMLEGEQYCAKVDIWAVGVVAFAVLSGEMPFEESVERGGRARLYQHILKGQYSFSAEVGLGPEGGKEVLQWNFHTLAQPTCAAGVNYSGWELKDHQ